MTADDLTLAFGTVGCEHRLLYVVAAGRDGLTALFRSLTCEDGEDNNTDSDAIDFHFCI